MATAKTSEQVQRDLFEPFNQQGSLLTVTLDNGEVVRLGMMDSYRVLSVLTHEGGDGMDFWLLVRALDWYKSFDTPGLFHVCKIVTWRQTPDGVVLNTEDGNTLEVEFLATPDELQQWQQAVQRRERQKDYAQQDQDHVRHFRAKIQRNGNPF